MSPRGGAPARANAYKFVLRAQRSERERVWRREGCVARGERRGALQQRAQGGGGRLERAHEPLEIASARARCAARLGYASRAHLAVHLQAITRLRWFIGKTLEWMTTLKLWHHLWYKKYDQMASLLLHNWPGWVQDQCQIFRVLRVKGQCSQLSYRAQWEKSEDMVFIWTLLDLSVTVTFRLTCRLVFSSSSASYTCNFAYRNAARL